MSARAAGTMVRHHCQCCGDELNAHSAHASGICGKRHYRDRKIQRVGAELLARCRRETPERLLARMAPALAAAADALCAGPDGILRAAVPWQGAPSSRCRPSAAPISRSTW